MPIALLALVAFIAVIVVWNVVFKRSMGEAMIVGFVVCLLFAGPRIPEVATSAVVAASGNEVLYAATAFVFMTYFIDKTGVIDKLIRILSATFGRLRGGPAIVDTIASGAMGAVAGGSNTGNAATSGSITGPWMIGTGWTRERSAMVIAGNAGLGAALPPSASMVIMIGFAGSMVTTSQVYLALLMAGIYQFAYRMVLIAWFVRRDGIGPAKNSGDPSLATAMRLGWPSTLIFLGAVLPIMITVGPIADWLDATGNYGDALGDISIITWIPILIMLIGAIVAWRELPRTLKGWFDLIQGSVPRFFTIGVLLFAAMAASDVLAQLGLAEDVDRLLGGTAIPLWLLVAFVGALVVIVAGPLTSSATLSAVGQVALLTLVSAGVDPILAVTALLVFASTEGASPPSSGSIFVACGITGARAEAIFLPLVVYYVLPFFILGVLIALGVIWVPTAG